jgi:hypothetical protein
MNTILIKKAKKLYFQKDKLNEKIVLYNNNL